MWIPFIGSGFDDRRDRVAANGNAVFGSYRNETISLVVENLTVRGVISSTYLWCFIVMNHEHEPTETIERAVTLVLLDDEGTRERRRLASYRDAIDAVRETESTTTVVKIESEDGEVVFNSAEMNIEDWESEWERAKQSLSVDVDEYECPYDNVGCFGDDLCVQCKMDSLQE